MNIIVETLNEALRLDPVAMSHLATYRVPCNQELAAHPTIQVSPDEHSVGLIGIINGVLGKCGLPLMAAVISKDGNVQMFLQP